MTYSFHEGERAVQARAGEGAIAQRNASVIGNTVIAGARPFIEKQVMVATTHRDGHGRLWAGLQFGAPGFARSLDGRAIALHRPEAERQADDPLWQDLTPDARLGLLFIELSSRRRYRVNGHVEQLDSTGLRLAIAEAFPNCPKYIQRRQPRGTAGSASSEAANATRGHLLNDAAMALLSAADTLFVASGAPDGHLDASHRGGPRGFIEVLANHRLRVPDYAGNSMFNTLGNLALDPACGLVVPDFETGRLLHLTGEARLLWRQPDPRGLTGGTGRFWEFEVHEWLLRKGAAPLGWEYLDASPFLPQTST